MLFVDSTFCDPVLREVTVPLLLAKLCLHPTRFVVTSHQRLEPKSPSSFFHLNSYIYTSTQPSYQPYTPS